MVSTGAVVSTTVIANDPAAALLCWSLAVQLTGVDPRANVDPLPGAHDTGTLPSTTSVADAVKATTAPLLLVASAVMGAGTTMAGFVVSATLTANVDDLVLPAASVA